MSPKDAADGPFVTLVTFFRVVLSPHGRGHGAAFRHGTITSEAPMPSPTMACDRARRSSRLCYAEPVLRSIFALMVGLVLLVLPAAAAAQPPAREITRLAGDVYRFRNNLHSSVFAVTPAGIIATDPISKDAAEWLKAELRQRFNRPVKYLVYSHDHADHIAGGEVFADTALVVAHENAKTQILDEKRPTAVPDITFSDRMTIELGGTVVELSWVGRNHSDNSIVMRFPRERLLFAVDFIPVQTVAFRDFPTSWIEDWIESLGRVERMDFDILVPGHGPVGRKEHVRIFREYLEDLRGQVIRYAREGKSLEEIKTLVDGSKYAGWTNFKEWFPLNIEGMYRQVQLHRRGN